MLRWNRFCWINSDLSQYFLRVVVTVRTRTLTTPHLPEEILKRLHLIDDLYEQGLKYPEIADHLNQQGIQSPRGDPYTPKKVWSTQKKFKLRKERLKDTTYMVDEVCPVVLERKRRTSLSNW